MAGGSCLLPTLLSILSPSHSSLFPTLVQILALEASVPIFTVALQATLSLILLDVPSNVAIISRSDPDPANGSLTLATYR